MIKLGFEEHQSAEFYNTYGTKPQGPSHLERYAVLNG